jgi:hypothetical protein
METKIEFIKSKIIALLNSDVVSFFTLKHEIKKMCVFMVYDHNSELVYIGSANKFDVRVELDKLHESNPLVNIMMKQNHIHELRQFKEYIKGYCSFRTLSCETMQEAKAIEHLAIYLLNPILNR